MEISEELLDIEGIKKSKKNILDMFIRRTAVITSTPESIVEKIVKDQWRSANKVTGQESDVSQIDFCNMGTFYISPSKARKRIAKMDKYNEEILNTGVNRTKVSNEMVLKKNRETEKVIKFKLKDRL